MPGNRPLCPTYGTKESVLAGVADKPKTMHSLIRHKTVMVKTTKNMVNKMTKTMKAAGLLMLCSPAVALTAQDTLSVTNFRYVGGYALQRPLEVDSTDVNAKRYDAASLLSTGLDLRLVQHGEPWSGSALPGDSGTLCMVGFDIEVTDYYKGQLALAKAPKQYELYRDGEKSQPGELTLLPGAHTFVIKYLSQGSDSLDVAIASDSAAHVPASSLRVADPAKGGNSLCTIEQQVKARGYSAVSISPDGKWVLTCTYGRNDGPEGTDWKYALIERSTGHKKALAQYSRWMPRSNKFYQTRRNGADMQLVVIDPVTLTEEVVADRLPEAQGYDILPTEDRLLLTIRQEGPKELNPDAYQFVHPDDRQPGWRDRSYLALYDIKTGLTRQLTFGYNSQWYADISADGSKILLAKSESRLTARPTSLTSLYVMDLDDLHLDTLVVRDGFIAHAVFSPDASQVCIKGSPECLDGVGNVCPDSLTPSMFDYQLYLMDVASRKVTPLTRDFDPSVNDFGWSRHDGQIYFSADCCDSCNLYTLDPKNGNIRMLAQPEEVVGRFDYSAASGTLVVSGESHDHSWRLYALETGGRKARQPQLLEDLNEEVYRGIEVADCEAWTCRNSIGDEVHCRYYLPDGFDPARKYPMIVYYYGGCSGTLRNFEYTYPWTIWAAQGYVCLVVNPSGASGFGQEWAARHVNTAGADPARDIIEATKAFCDEHAYVDPARLGCIGASYGGFMTQYLQTVTDIFRCAVAHAGISDHTTYWGYGYWGYTYSEVSMANSYPWTRKDLYVDHSPIYNVDKIKSSMLFLHGDQDTNVPYNNSVQMYTALKLLGKDVAMVSIKGEDHGIRKPSRRILWHNATMAWFARCLKGDSTWWDALYPPKTL